MMRALPLLALLLFARVAHADEPVPSETSLPSEGPRNAITTSLIAPIGRGVSFGYERAFVGSKLGLTTHYGMRILDGGDFRTRGYGLGLELRWYTLGRAAFRRIATRAMVGLFVYGRGSWTLTVLREDDARQLVGRGHRIGAQLGLGYRFMLGSVIELTPTIGLDLRTDVVRGLAYGLRPSMAFGMSMGFLFDAQRGR